MDDRYVADSVLELAEGIAAAHDLSEAAMFVATTMLDLVADADGATVSVLLARTPALEAFTDGHVRLAEELQFEHGEGPLYTALASGGTVVTPRAIVDERWPTWGAALQEARVGSVISVPLAEDRKRYATLTLYSADADVFSPATVETVERLARVAGAVLSVVRRADHLSAGLEARTQVGVAIGMLMQGYGMAQEQAFDALHRYSSSLQKKLHLVARELIEAGGRLPDLPRRSAKPERRQD